MTVTVTENAAQQIQKQLAKRGRGIGLRLGVKKAGCSGYSYALDYVDQLHDSDTIYESQGVKIVVADADIALLHGIELDYRREGINQAFVFNNPNSKNTCGCGASFAV